LKIVSAGKKASQLCLSKVDSEDCSGGGTARSNGFCKGDWKRPDLAICK